MRKVKFINGFIIFSALSIVAMPTYSEGLDSATYHYVSDTVVRVYASSCPTPNGSMDGERTLNGFFWGGNTPGEKADIHIVTSRHGVAGCNTVEYCMSDVRDTCDANATARRIAHLDKTVAKTDLALLRTDSPPQNIQSLKDITTPAINDRVYVVAHWLNAAATTDKEIRIGNGSKTLDDKLVGKPKKDLAVLQSPSLTLAVLNLDGLIIDGVSGAPLVSKDGQLVGIIDGGLPNGVAGINWAIPASEIQGLLASTEPLPTIAEGKKAAVHHAQEFAMSSIDSAANAVHCGNGTYVHTKTLSLREIAAATDDPLGLQQLISTTGALQLNPNFDVYAEASSAAAFVVPAGAIVSDNGNVCLATVRSSPTADIVIKFGSQIVNNKEEAQSKSVEFEKLIADRYFSTINLQWSYPLVQTRYDGADFRRRMQYLWSAMPGAWPPMPAHLEGYWFETFAKKGDSFVAAAATYTSKTIDLAQVQFGCPSFIANCQSVTSDQTTWTSAILAIHLTTFPVN